MREPYITLADYQKASRRTMPDVMDDKERLILALGLNGEAGELGELLKKATTATASHWIPLSWPLSSATCSGIWQQSPRRTTSI
jgi:hypothetical protein